MAWFPLSVIALVRCWLPIAGVWSLVWVAAADAGTVWSAPRLGLALAGTLAVYSADRIDDPTVPTSLRPVLWLATVLGVLGVLAALPFVDGWTWVLVAVAGAAGLLHRWLRHVLPKNEVVALAWTVVVLDTAGCRPPSVAMLAAVVLVVWSACVLCDLKDVARDSQDGTCQPIRRLSWPGHRVALVGALVALGIAWGSGLTWVGWEAVGLLPLALLPTVVQRPVLGPILVDGVLALPGVVLMGYGICR